MNFIFFNYKKEIKTSAVPYHILLCTVPYHIQDDSIARMHFKINNSQNSKDKQEISTTISLKYCNIRKSDILIQYTKI